MEEISSVLENNDYSCYTFMLEWGFCPRQKPSYAVFQDSHCMPLDADDVHICRMLIGWQVDWTREGSGSRVCCERKTSDKRFRNKS